MKRQEEKLPFFGQTFVVTGITTAPREDIVDRIRELGGKVTLSVSKSTTYLVAGSEPGPAKMKKALDAGTKIISEEAFVEMTQDYVVQPVEVKRVKLTESAEKWIDKYRPQALNELVGNQATIAELRKHFIGLNRRPLLLSGAAGVGKTLSVYLAAKERGISLIEYNGGDYRNKAEIGAIKMLSSQQTLRRDLSMDRNKVILLEEVENMGVSDRGGLQEMLNLFKETKVPIVITVNDKTNPKLKSILAECKVLTYNKIDNKTLAGYFKKIVDREGVPIPDHTLLQMASVSGGDVRYGVNMLQYVCKKTHISQEDLKVLGKHFTAPNLFDTTKNLFAPGVSVTKKYDAYYEDPTMALQMVFENYLEGSIHSAAAIADSLSVADTVEKQMLYEGRKDLFPLGGYYTAVRPPLRLTTRINFAKYLGFSSTKRANQRKYHTLLHHLSYGGYAGGWSTFYYLPVIIAQVQSKLPASMRSRYLHQLFMDKTDLKTVLDMFKTKVVYKELAFTRSWKEEC